MALEVTLIADPRVLAIPIEECGEPLVDLRLDSQLAVDTRNADAAGLFARIRSGVAERLGVAAQAAPEGVQLLILEGFRPVELQQRYFDEYAQRLAAEQPEWSAAEVRTAASRFVAPPDIDPPHSTGGAIDLTLADAAGAELDMGCPVDASPEDSDGACYTYAPGLSPAAKMNRTLLIELMSTAGFVNYGTEWWHWSYGDRYWAYSTGEPAARYASVKQ
jgi:zinc D-Ala-D-Ala dipeptidase